MQDTGKKAADLRKDELTAGFKSFHAFAYVAPHLLGGALRQNALRVAGPAPETTSFPQPRCQEKARHTVHRCDG